jgi:hypothetical protein
MIHLSLSYFLVNLWFDVLLIKSVCNNRAPSHSRKFYTFTFQQSRNSNEIPIQLPLLRSPHSQSLIQIRDFFTYVGNDPSSVTIAQFKTKYVFVLPAALPEVRYPCLTHCVLYALWILCVLAVPLGFLRRRCEACNVLPIHTIMHKAQAESVRRLKNSISLCLEAVTLPIFINATLDRYPSLLKSISLNLIYHSGCFKSSIVSCLLDLVYSN